MIMLNLTLYFILNIFSFSNPIENSSWIRLNNDIYEIRIYSDKYFAVSTYNIENNTFISALGGIYSMEEGYYEVLEFNSLDSTSVGDTIYYSKIKVDVKNNTGKMSIDGKKFIKNPNEDQLQGAWLMSGIERRGEMRMRDVNRSRKTLKMLAGGRFQWIAYDVNKKGFYGTGGGTYSAINGK